MSSDPSFHRVLSSHEYETFTFPKHILYDEKLTGNAVRLLLVMLDYGRRPNWQLRQTHLLAMSGMKYAMFSSAMKVLEESGYVKRFRKKTEGKWLPYEFKFSAFPIFLKKSERNPLHNEFEPDAVFQFRESSSENRNFTYSNTNVLEETTNPTQGQDCTGVVLGSSLSKEKIKSVLEAIPGLSKTQKTTLIKKYSEQQISDALKAIDLSKARSVFAVIVTAIEEKWQINTDKDTESKEKALRTFAQAEKHLLSRGNCPISISNDANFAYIHHGTASTKFLLRCNNFTKDFAKAINKYLKGQ